MEALADVYTIPQEHLDLCATIGQIARGADCPARGRDRRAEYPWDCSRCFAQQDLLGPPFRRGSTAAPAPAR